MVAIFSIFELLLKYIFIFSYSFSNSYGFSIILLSIIVNIILLPLYIIAEKLQKQEIFKQQAMQKKLSEIKHAFRGQEQFMMIQSLYKLHSYHPIMGLRSVGSLLIQIPFFFAAYHMLSNFVALEEVSFFFIKDLSKADALIPFGRYRINILPIIMTLINIIAANIYTRRVDQKSLVATWTMALIFLVLLYVMPSGLVLYWTCNNIFALVKNGILSLRLKENKHMEKSATQIAKERLIAFLENDIKVIKSVFFLWLFSGYLVIAFILRLENRLKGEIPNTLLGVTVLLLTISASILLLYFYRKQIHKQLKLKSNAPSHSHIVTVITYIIFFGSIVCMVLGATMLLYYIQLPVFMIDIEVVWFKLQAFAIIIFPNIILCPYILYVLFRLRHMNIQTLHGSHSNKNTVSLIQKKSELKEWRYILLASSFAAVLLVFVILPAEIYKSDPIAVAVPFTTVIFHMLPYITICLLIPMLLWLFCSYYLKKYLSYVVLLLSSVIVMYALLIPFHIGGLDNFTLMSPQAILPSAWVYLFEGMALIFFAFKLFAFFRSNRKLIISILVAVNIILIYILVNFSFWLQNNNDILKVLESKSKDNKNNKDNIEALNTTRASTSTVPSIAKRLFSFSSTKKNIVVLLLDMSNGGDIQRLLEENPTIAEQLKGFIWYPNTLSISTYTSTSKPSIMAGWNYTPENIINIKKNNLAEKIMNAYDTMFSVFKKHNYLVRTTGVGYYGGDYAQCKDLEAQDIACLDYWDNSFVGYWKQKNSEQKAIIDENFSVDENISLLVLAGLLRSVPIMMKHMVYDNGNWNMDKSKLKNKKGYMWALKEWTVLDSLRDLSSKLENKQENIYKDTLKNESQSPSEYIAGTFTFLHSNITHRPYALDKNCVLQNKQFPDESAGNDYQGDAAYFSLRCSIESLTKWFAWLKKNNMYDNTKIIMVSDHGNDFHKDYMNRNNISSEFLEIDYPYMFSRSHALLLVKDFNKNDAFHIDNRLMSNTDTATIMYSGIDDYVYSSNAHVFDMIDYSKQKVSSRTVPVYHTDFYNWIDLVQEKDQFKIKYKYMVTDNMFEPENWKKVK